MAWGEDAHYRRPLRDLIEPLTAAGFVIDRLCEPDPSEVLKASDPKGYDRLSRIPAFVFLRARKARYSSDAMQLICWAHRKQEET